MLHLQVLYSLLYMQDKYSLLFNNTVRQDMKKFLLPVIAALSVILTSCDMKFGDDVELSGAAFDATKLSQVSTHTGVTFPTGSVGVEYFYLGSGIDDALAAKIMIPETAVKEFNTNPVFTTGTNSKANIEIGLLRLFATLKVDYNIPPPWSLPRAAKQPTLRQSCPDKSGQPATQRYPSPVYPNHLWLRRTGASRFRIQFSG
jgi:hypothetical protein